MLLKNALIPVTKYTTNRGVLDSDFGLGGSFRRNSSFSDLPDLVGDRADLKHIPKVSRNLRMMKMHKIN